MTVLADAYVRARLQTDRLGPELKKAGDTHGKTFGGSFAQSAGRALAAAGVAAAAASFFKGAFSEARESAKVTRLTESAIKATGGAAKITAAQVADLASAISNKTGKDDEAIQSGQNMLLTFKNIQNAAGRNNDIFNQASTVLTDMVAAMNGGEVTQENMSKGAIQLGKALNDPIKGVGALSRVGVTFTDAQKEQIKTLVETGDTMGAQKIILAELKSEFAGAAKATSDPADRARVAWGNLQETIGTKLIPAFSGLIEKLTSVANFVGEHIKLFGVLAGVIGTVVAVTWAVNAATTAWVAMQKVAKAATVAWTGVQWLLNAALTANPIGIVIVAVAALAAAIVIAWKKSETFRKIVQAVWSAIKIAVGAVVSWFTGTIVPSLSRALGTVTGAFRGMRDGLSTAWGFIRDKVFNPIKTFILTTIPNAFRDGVKTVGKWWDGLKAIAAKPVRFVIDTVINKGIIGGINWVAGKVGAKGVKEVPMPKGLGDGLGLRAGDGIGDLFRGAISPIGNPVGWLTDRLSGPIGSIKKKFGDNPFTSMLVGAGKKTLGFGAEKVKSLLSFLDFGAAGRGVGSAAAGALGAGSFAGLANGISAVLADLRSVFGAVGVISGYRPGARTLSGNVSYHASGRAIDIAPVLGWAQYLRWAWGPRLRELITPWNALNILNGRPHTYTGAVWAQHNFAGGNAHIHAALDDGGLRWLRPGYNIIPNGTGRLEPIAGPRAMAGMSSVYNVNVYPSPLAHPADVGKEVVKAIQAFERGNGAGWRR